MECLDWVIEVVRDFVDGRIDEIETQMSIFKVILSIYIKMLTNIDIMNFLDLQWCSGLLYSGKQNFINFGFLQRHILVTKPRWPQSVFGNSYILLCLHSESRAM